MNIIKLDIRKLQNEIQELRQEIAELRILVQTRPITIPFYRDPPQHNPDWFMTPVTCKTDNNFT